jgi:Rad52/22 family double-strand break repair protein
MSEATQPQQEKTRPAYGRSIIEIVADLSKDVPVKMLAEKTMGGKKITFLPWYRAARMLDYYAPGWSYEIRSITTVADQLIVTVRLSIPCAEGVVSREATGIEDEEVKGYGDTVSNACSMALRRAAALFGLGRHLYEK